MPNFCIFYFNYDWINGCLFYNFLQILMLPTNLVIVVESYWLTCVMVSMLASSAVDRGYNQTQDYEIVSCCFSTKHVALMSKSKDWLDRNQNNVSEWSNMSNYGLLFQ